MILCSATVPPNNQVEQSHRIYKQKFCGKTGTTSLRPIFTGVLVSDSNLITPLCFKLG